MEDLITYHSPNVVQTRFMIDMKIQKTDFIEVKIPTWTNFSISIDPTKITSQNSGSHFIEVGRKDLIHRRFT